MQIFAKLRKVVEDDDGTLEIEGIASTETIDRDGEIVKASAIKAALPDFMDGGSGPLREMHRPIAAGKVVEATIDLKISNDHQSSRRRRRRDQENSNRRASRILHRREGASARSEGPQDRHEDCAHGNFTGGPPLQQRSHLDAMEG